MPRVILTAMLCSMILIGNGGCFLQPVSKVEMRYSFIDMDAPALRLARPVKAELLEKQDGEWVNIGTGTIPAGAYVKGRSPVER